MSDLEREWLRLRAMPRDLLIAWLVWNDPNGVYRDEDMVREGYDPMSHNDATDAVYGHVLETGETPESMIKGSRRPW